MKEIEMLSLLRRAHSYLTPSCTMGPVYISPAQQLRDQADEIEERETFIVELEQAINKLEK